MCVGGRGREELVGTRQSNDNCNLYAVAINRVSFIKLPKGDKYQYVDAEGGLF